MTQQLQKAISRLDNIRKVQPILAALRTISLGSWQAARSRRSGLTAYTSRLLDLLAVVLPAIVEEERRPRFGWPGALKRGTRASFIQEREIAIIALVVGTERGLCGRYNQAVVDRLEDYVAELPPNSALTLMASGSRMVRELRSAGHHLSWTREASVAALPPFGLALGLVEEWLQRYEAYELDAVDVIYNADQGAGKYAANVARLIPPKMPEPSTSPTADSLAGGQTLPNKDRVTVETDAVGLYVRIVQQWTAIGLYELLLEAASTEHAARYQLMEAATQNAEDLAGGLMLVVQSARRQAITRQVQELAVGAGLVGSDSSKG